MTASSRATTATLGWPAVAGARGYAVYRRSGSGTLTFVNRALGNSFSDSGLALGTPYTYEVRALSGSNEWCASTAAAP